MVEPSLADLLSHSHEVTSLPFLLKSHAQQTPHAIAITAPGRAPLTYGRLFKQVEAVAATLKTHRLGPQDRVAVVLPNGPEMAVAFLTIACTVTCAPLNPSYRVQELEFFLDDLEAKAVVVQSDMETPVRTVAQAKGIPVIELVPTVEAEAGLFTLKGKTCSPPFPHVRDTRANDVALVLHTSGTTARPKLVPLTHANLVTSANHIVNSLELTPQDRCLNIMPLFHIHGLVGALVSSLAAGGGVVCTPGFYAPNILGWVEDFRATWYTAVPTMHQGIVTHAKRHLSRARSAPLRFIRSSSASLPPSVMHDLEEVFSCSVIEAYGMTEAAHQMASNPLGEGKQKPGSVGRAAGPDMVIIDEQGEMVPSGESGEIAIRGPNVMAGYDHNPEANAVAFTAGWFRTGDRGYLDDDGYLFLTGRLKEMINRAGEKIAPWEVDDVLLSHPAVAQAVTFALPDPHVGEEVAAAVVLSAGATCHERELQEFSATRIADFKVPRRIVFLEDIPKGPTGKLQRLGLAESLDLKTHMPGSVERLNISDTPDSPIEEVLIELWCEVLQGPVTAVEQSFLDLGGDSILVTQLLNRISDRFGVELSHLDVFDAVTIRQQAVLIDQVMGRAIQEVLTRPGLGAVLASTSAPPEKSGREGSEVQTEKKGPVSATQQRMWFFQQLHPENIVLARPIALRLTGRIEVGVLEQSLSKIVRRHEILRTAYQEQAGAVYQVVLPSQPFSLEVQDFRDIPQDQHQARVQTLASREAQKIINLSQGPLYRGILLTLDEHTAILMIIIHHIAFDGWSEGILIQELGTLYEAFLEGNPSPLPPLPLQYTEFAREQHQRFAGVKHQEHLAYWKQQLQGLDETLYLPTRTQDNTVSFHERGQRTFVLPLSLTTQLEELSRQEHVTLYMTLLGAFQVLLGRYSQNDDISVGTLVAGRTRKEVEPLIGCFVNLLVMRTDLTGHPSFQAVLKRVRKMASGAYASQEVPFEHFLGALQPNHRLNHSTLFQVVFDMRNMPQLPALELSSLRIDRFPFSFNYGTWTLVLQITKTSEGLHCTFHYASQLFTENTIERMEGHFRQLLMAVVSNPTHPITTLPLLTKEETQILWENQKDTFDQRNHACLHQCFEEMVRLSPHKVAVACEHESVTYQQLNERANQLAHLLRRQGVGPEAKVAVCVERSVNMVVALLGILKAGGAYVPLDPSLPKERVRFMLRDIKAKWLVAEQSVADNFPDHEAHEILMDRDEAALRQENVLNPVNGVHPENLAYIIFTSGTTGNPKGVLVTHQNVVSLLNSTQGQLHFGPQDVWTMFHSFTFDFSVWELWGALMFGGKLVVVPFEVSRSSYVFYDLMIDHQVTVLNQTPSAFQQLVQEEPMKERQGSLNLRLVILGGEALELTILTPWFDRYGDQRPVIMNMYGITETTVHVTCKHITEHDVRQRCGSVIGIPIPHWSVYLLDRHQQPVPIGVPGEMYIGGAGMARGYLNQPELTSTRFIPNPFCQNSHTRLYRSGDRARYTVDGDLEYLGRVDRQVKLRGFRIELGEVETLLTKHPDVTQAFVMVREDQPGDHRLIAYLIPQQENGMSVPQLRQKLKQWLPVYMMPSSFILVSRWPLTRNGKIDVDALPFPENVRQDVGHPVDLPRTPIEKSLAEIWCALLKIDQVGIHDNFFDLGGHSLLLTQVASRVWDVFHIRLPLRVLFDQATIEEMALAVVERRIAGADRTRVEEMFKKIAQLSPEEVSQLLKHD